MAHFVISILTRPLTPGRINFEIKNSVDNIRIPKKRTQTIRGVEYAYEDTQYGAKLRGKMGVKGEFIPDKQYLSYLFTPSVSPFWNLPPDSDDF
jgi:hypothetical protein